MLCCAPDAFLKLPLHYVNTYAKLPITVLGYLQCSFMLLSLSIALHCAVLLHDVHLNARGGGEVVRKLCDTTRHAWAFASR